MGAQSILCSQQTQRVSRQHVRFRASSRLSRYLSGFGLAHVGVPVFGVRCTEDKIVLHKGTAMENVLCWDDFNSTLTVFPSLPAGLSFSNNVISGRPTNGSSWTRYVVSSKRDPANPFSFILGSTEMRKQSILSLLHSYVIVPRQQGAHSDKGPLYRLHSTLWKHSFRLL